MNRDEQFDRILSRSLKPRGPHPSSESCLSAEQIAAWMEDALLPHERNAAEAHAATCGRCLAILGVAARTVPVEARAPWWRTPLRVRWLVPVTAAAAAVALWVAVNPGFLPDEADATRPSAVDQAAGATEQLPLPAAPGTPEPVPEARRSSGESAPAAGTPAKPPPSPGRLADRREADSVRAEKQAETPRDTVTTREQAAARGPHAPAPSQPAEGAASAPPGLQRFAAAALEILTPDPEVRWRVIGSSIQRSLDGGRTWEPQFEAHVPLVAGSAPSTTVCWIVGRSGAVYVTSDGRSWRQAAPPARTDLTGVTAESARSATVTGSDGRSYRTSDGGATWVVQEMPAGPF